jgi:hypothetical protein
MDLVIHVGRELLVRGILEVLRRRVFVVRWMNVSDVEVLMVWIFFHGLRIRSHIVKGTLEVNGKVVRVFSFKGPAVNGT